jgi:hypothetical protein
LTPEGDQQYAYLTLPPHGELRSCVGLVMAGMAARAKVGVGGLDEDRKSTRLNSSHK